MIRLILAMKSWFEHFKACLPLSYLDQLTTEQIRSLEQDIHSFYFLWKIYFEASLKIFMTVVQDS